MWGEALGGGTHDPEGIAHVLTMGPGLHAGAPRRTTAAPSVARTRAPGSTGRHSRRRRSWPGERLSHQASSSSPPMARPGTRWTSIGSGRARSSSTDRVGTRPGRPWRVVPASSKYARWLIWSRTAQPSAGVARSHRGSESDRLRHDGPNDVVFGVEVLQQVRQGGHAPRLRQPPGFLGSWSTRSSPPSRATPRSHVRTSTPGATTRSVPPHRGPTDQARRPRDGGETELTPLPLVLTADLGGGHLEPGPCAVDEMAHDRTFLLERVAGGDPEVDGEGTGVEHDHHTARQAQGALARRRRGSDAGRDGARHAQVRRDGLRSRRRAVPPSDGAEASVGGQARRAWEAVSVSPAPPIVWRWRNGGPRFDPGGGRSGVGPGRAPNRRGAPGRRRRGGRDRTPEIASPRATTAAAVTRTPTPRFRRVAKGSSDVGSVTGPSCSVTLMGCSSVGTRLTDICVS